MAKKKKIRQNALVRFVTEGMTEDQRKSYPFTTQDQFVYLGDIAQMPGHCILVRLRDNKVFTCYHTDSFVEVPDEEA